MRHLEYDDIMEDSLLEPRPTHWSWPENIAQVRINDESCWALLDNGSMVNAVTPEFVKAHCLDVGLLSNLVNSNLSGYVIIGAQGEGVQAHDEVALVIPHPTDFGAQVLVILGTLTINQIINMIKESEIDELSISLNGSKISYLLACHWEKCSIKRETGMNWTRELTDLNEAVKMTKKEEIDAFSSEIIHTWAKAMFLGSNMHMMMIQTLEGDGPYLLHRLSIMNTYTEMATGTK